jgi:uncharacterized protein YebE (UPF0316 family)
MTKTILILIGIFVAGLITDLLTTKYTQAVGDKKVWYATILSLSITFAQYGLLVYLMTDVLNVVHNIVAYGAGNGLGTFIAMKKRA